MCIELQVYKPRSFTDVVPLTKEQHEEISRVNKEFVKRMLQLSLSRHD